MSETERRCYANGLHDMIFLARNVRSHPVKPPTGFLYAAKRRDGLLKVGQTQRQCPICRAIQGSAELVALAYSPDTISEEKQLLKLLGKPCKGKEIFDEYETRIQYILSNKILLCVTELEKFFAKQDMPFLRLGTT